MTGPPPATLRHAREEIAEAVDRGATLDDIEATIIDRRPVGEDARAALWLYAWGTIERAASRAGRPAPL